MDSRQNPQLNQIGQIAINVHDLERAIEFYRHDLGMQFLFQVPQMAFFDCGSIRVMLGVPEDPAFDHPSSIIYFLVDDIQTDFQALSARGVNFTGEPELIAKMEDHDLWMAFFKDLDGNTLALMSEVR